MHKRKFTRLLSLGMLLLTGSGADAQISLLQDYKNYASAPIGTFQGINFREAGFSALYPIAGTNGREFWTCSDRGVNVDAASANPAGCTPTYDKAFSFPSYAPKIHRVRISGDSIQILRTITIKRPNGASATGVLLPAGLGSTAAEQASTDTVLDCANFAGKVAAKDTFSIDCEGLVVDRDGNFWLCEENGPTIWKLNQNGVLMKRYTPYANLPGTQGVDAQIDSAFRYRKNNRGFENMAITPRGMIYAIIQSPLLYPTTAIGENSRVHRILELNPATGAMRMFAYLNDGITGTSGGNQIRLRDWKLGDMAAINDTTFLVLEAALRGTTDIKRLYRINISNATPVNSGLYGTSTLEGLVDSTGLAGQGVSAVKKTLVMDLLANGWPAALDKAEGVAIINDSTIAIGNDNDYGQTSPLQNGIATATSNLSHIITYRLSGTNRLSNFRQLITTLTAGITGPSSSRDPYLIPTTTSGKFTAIMTAGDMAPNGYRMSGLPDGLGAFDNGNGTFTLLMNHEMGSGSGVARSHGDTGAFVSNWIINKSDFALVRGSDLMKRVKLWNPTTSSYITYNPSFQPSNGSAGFNRFCSGDLAPTTAYYNYLTGKGTQERIYMNGEENGNEGRGMGHIVTGADSGTSYELPYLGKYSWENALACPRISDTTIVVGTDDATPGQVYFYVGLKQSIGNDIEKAGLTGGNLWSLAVSGMLSESSSSIPAAGTSFTMVNLGQVHNTTGASLESASNTAGVTRFLRPEDGAWDAQTPGDFYFATTNAFNAPSRLWRLRFTNPGNITQGGTITAVLDGTEGQQMLDNIGIDNAGHVVMVEDVGNNAWLGRMLRYDMASDVMTTVAIHDSTRFKTGAANFLTQDEEASGPIDAQAILGPGWFLVDDQAHYSLGGDIVEGGQMLAYYDSSIAQTVSEIAIKGNSTLINDGDNTPSTTDSTDFGIVNTNTATRTRSFVIENSGPGTLKVTGISISGANASSFSLVSPSANPYFIVPGGSMSVAVNFAPTSDGVRNATLGILSNDNDESIYDFAIRGTGGSPDINVQGNTIGIFDGDQTPGTANNTDFGSVVTGANSSKTFTIQNTGAADLSVASINFSGVDAADFTIAGAPAFPLVIPAAGTQNITVQFTPSATGLRTAAINLGSNDLDEATYDFALQGRGVDATSVSSVPSAAAIKLYPNPTGGDATIAMNLKKEDRIIITIIAQDGKVAVAPVDRTYHAGEQEIILPTAALANGVYFVQVATGYQTFKVKLVVAH
jgi:hypothetical protein